MQVSQGNVRFRTENHRETGHVPRQHIKFTSLLRTPDDMEQPCNRVEHVDIEPMHLQQTFE